MEAMLELLANKIADKVLAKIDSRLPGVGLVFTEDDADAELLKDGVVTPRQAAKMLGVSESSIRNMLKLNVFPVIEFSISGDSRPTVRRTLRIPKRSVQEFVEKHLSVPVS